ncbi:ABC transporter permease [Desnuesiella massiliensis]|uniref:ABC transporter permease n=1 Tax=Desnuesiella massiliensis TaxID=1650662 RepID=UPI0006E395AA|nr:ABC transporter permease [Desnuesiella massiliensis]
MRIKATIKVTFKAMRAQWKQLLLVYAIFPLLLSLVMGYFQKDTFRPEVSLDKINLTIVDEDKSKSSQGFKELFQAEGIKDLFNISEKGDYVITIPKGYEDNLINLKDMDIKVDEKKRVSRTNEAIVRIIINQYGESLTESLIISNKINEMTLKDKEKLFNEVTNSINSLGAKSALKTNIIQGERTLSSFENQAASMMSYMLFMMIMGCVGGYHLDKENGSFKRLMSTPITKETFFNLDLLIFFLSSFIYGLIYVATFRIAGLAFKGTNPMNIIAILAAQSLLVTSLAGLMIAFLGKQNSNIIIILSMYFEIIFGGAFIPIKDITNKVFALLTRFAPGNVLTQAYKNCILFNSFQSIIKYLSIMILISIGAYAISILKVKIKWEE